MKKSELAKQLMVQNFSNGSAYRLLDKATATGLLQFDKKEKTYKLIE